MTHRHYEQDFSPWWFLLAPIAWVVLLTLAFGPVLLGGHYEPKVRHPVRVQMDIPPLLPGGGAAGRVLRPSEQESEMTKQQAAGIAILALNILAVIVAAAALGG